jgi:hypothetical protein
LASLLSELYCLAGWQTLDLGLATQSWHYYDLANTAAFESNNYSFKALAEAGRAFVLVDIGEASTAVDLVDNARRAADRSCSRLTRSWLAASYGEVLAADGRVSESLHAFDRAETLLTASTSDTSEPYMALDSVHLERWRGNALARSGVQEAVGVLAEALKGLDSTFIRAETSLRVDLVFAHVALGNREEVRIERERAGRLAAQIGSVRQRRRLATLRD